MNKKSCGNCDELGTYNCPKTNKLTTYNTCIKIWD